MSDYEHYQKDSFRMTPLLTIVSLIVLLGLMAWLWFSRSPAVDMQTLDVPTVTTVPEQEPQEFIKPSVAPFEESRFDEENEAGDQPLAKEEAEEAPKINLPSLNDSDEPLKKEIGELSVDQALVKLLVPERIILKTVRAVLALDEGDVVKDFRPVKSPAPPFKVVKIDEPLNHDVGQRYKIDPRNYERYKNYLKIFSSLDKQKLAVLYKNYYPLLEEAYGQYGVDKGGFDKVFNDVIDRVIASRVFDQVSEEDLVLIQPKVFYIFQNKKIEDLTSLDKLLLRIGEKNTQELQQQLQIFKEAIQS